MNGEPGIPPGACPRARSGAQPCPFPGRAKCTSRGQLGLRPVKSARLGTDTGLVKGGPPHAPSDRAGCAGAAARRRMRRKLEARPAWRGETRRRRERTRVGPGRSRPAQGPGQRPRARRRRRRGQRHGPRLGAPDPRARELGQPRGRRAGARAVRVPRGRLPLGADLGEPGLGARGAIAARVRRTPPLPARRRRPGLQASQACLPRLCRRAALRARVRRRVPARRQGVPEGDHPRGRRAVRVRVGQRHDGARSRRRVARRASSTCRSVVLSPHACFHRVSTSFTRSGWAARTASETSA